MKHLLFDFDGTLVETKIGVINSVRYAFEVLNIECNLSDFELEVLFVGPPLTAAFADFTDKVAEAIEAFRSRYRTIGVYENKQYPYLKETLSELKNSGNKLYIASSKPKAFIINILEQRDLACFFESIHSPGFDEGTKTKFDVISEACNEIKTLDYSPKIYMIGDRKFDIEGAHKANICAIGVRWGSAGENELEASGAEYTVNDYKELAALVKEL